MRFGLNVEDKKTLVKRIGELTDFERKEFEEVRKGVR